MEHFQERKVVPRPWTNQECHHWGKGVRVNPADFHGDHHHIIFSPTSLLDSWSSSSLCWSVIITQTPGWLQWTPYKVRRPCHGFPPKPRHQCIWVFLIFHIIVIYMIMILILRPLAFQISSSLKSSFSLKYHCQWQDHGNKSHRRRHHWSRNKNQLHKPEIRIFNIHQLLFNDHQHLNGQSDETCDSPPFG